LRVSVVVLSFNSKGHLETCVRNLVHSSSECGFEGEIHVVAELRLLTTGDRPSLWGRLPAIMQFWVIWLMYRQLCRLVPELQPDLIHAQSPSLNGVAAQIACRRFWLPLVYEVRGICAAP